MSNNRTLSLTTTNLPTFLDNINRHFLGFDDLVTQIQTFENSSPQGFPPYNIVRYGENQFEVTLAVAGFTQDEINITLENNTLYITGVRKEEVENSEKQYIYKGIGFRNFRREFTLGTYMVIKGATIKDGLLTVSLEREIPEAMKPRTIPIVQI